MAKGKKKRSTKKSTKKTARPKGDACPECGQTRSLFWHGRRVLCEPCIEDNTHEAERGEITKGGLVRGAMALFRDVGAPVIALLLGYSVASKTVVYGLSFEDNAHLAASIAREIIGLVFVAAALDVGLRRLDGESNSLSGSLGLGVRKFLPLFLAQSLEGLIVGVHLVLLIVPGVVKALSYAVLTPLVVSGESGAISSLHESWRRMQGHRRAIAPLMFALWLPFMAAQYLGAALLSDPSAISDSKMLMAVDVFYPLLDVPWLFVALTLHARLRRRFRLAADPG